MASVRALLILICAVSVRSQLLPIDLSALTSGLLPLAGDLTHRGVLNTVGDVISLGVNTVGGVGHNVLGLREPVTQNQGYVLMTINGMQVLVPVSNVLSNGLQDFSRLAPNPVQPTYVSMPNNPQILQNPITSRPVNDPIVNYVTAASQLNNVNLPAVSNDGVDAVKVTLDNNIKLENAKDVTDEIDFPVAV